MADLKFAVNADRCTRCGACVRDCPMGIISAGTDGVPFIPAEKSDACIRCQHCLAVCPTAAISILGLSPENSLPILSGKCPTFEQQERLIRGRRSVRSYLDENVSPELIRKLLAAVANAPTGCNHRAMTFTVIDDKSSLARLREMTLDALAQARKTVKVPDRIAFIWDAVDARQSGGADEIFRGAPHALIVSDRPDSPCAAENVIIALSYFELLANSADLGTVWCGMLKIAMEICPKLKEAVGLPADVAYYPMLFGLPKVRYARTVQRDDSAAIKRVSL